MVDGSSADLLEEINRKLARRSLLPMGLAAATAALPVLLLTTPPPLALPAWGVVLLVVFLAVRYLDLVGKSVVLLYEVDSEVADEYEKGSSLSPPSPDLPGCGTYPNPPRLSTGSTTGAQRPR